MAKQANWAGKCGNRFRVIALSDRGNLEESSGKSARAGYSGIKFDRGNCRVYLWIIVERLGAHAFVGVVNRCKRLYH